MHLALNTFINTKTSRPVCLCLSALHYPQWIQRQMNVCQSSQGLRGQCNKTQGQFNKFDSMGILQ